MNSFVISTLCCFFTLIPISSELSCVSCVGSSNSGCNDPFNEATSGDIQIPGSTYCLKVVYSNYVERMAGGRACTSGSGPGGSTYYCCSDKDYCNKTSTNYPVSIVAIIIHIVVLLFIQF
ncbi:unnamed protein product [Adineta steineri]|uniref:Uncharacterized protein n=1 Tax=Adineta steineri TaxID=433720 RepID=A0A815UHC3_9BILA|nr:unnamed protein product [Adineta steineri]CAF3762975.1 unnamed protein product [Adineta steineri]